MVEDALDVGGVDATDEDARSCVAGGCERGENGAGAGWVDDVFGVFFTGGEYQSNDE